MIVQGDKVIPIIRIVIAIERKLVARGKRDGIQIPDIGGPQLFQSLLTGLFLFSIDRLPIQQTHGRQHDQAQCGEPLLPVNDLKGPVITSLQHQIAHIVRGLAILGQSAKNVCPQIFPMFFIP